MSVLLRSVRPTLFKTGKLWLRVIWKDFTEITDVAGTTSVVAESQCGSVLLHFLASLETCHRHLPVPIRSRLPILTCTEPVFQKLP
ncbi:hypothetical protein NC651_013550 [Populus alba x Populus x berolinensis]|nr:hypothetical protein NC651_013550 [Populus alba x Populus x berolinensis]